MQGVSFDTALIRIRKTVSLFPSKAVSEDKAWPLHVICFHCDRSVLLSNKTA